MLTRFDLITALEWWGLDGGMMEHWTAWHRIVISLVVIIRCKFVAIDFPLFEFFRHERR